MSKKRLFRALNLIVFLYLIYVLIVLALPFGGNNLEDGINSGIQIRDAVISYESTSMPVRLPYSLKGLKPGTEVTLTMTIPDADFRYLCVKSVYSPMKVNIEGYRELSYGQKGTYPGCMREPPTFFKMIPVDTDIRGKTLELKYVFPRSVNELYIYSPIYGSYISIAKQLALRTGVTFFVGVFMIVLGIAFVFVSVVIMFIEKKGVVFLWLGCFCISVGMWDFGESDIAWFIINNFSIMYVCDYIGLFMMAPMLHQFVIEMVKFHHFKILRINTVISYIMVSLIAILQIMGKMMLIEALNYYILAVPYVLVVLIGMIIYEWVKYENINAKKLLMPTIILIISAILEILNYCFGVSRSFATIFQIGMVIFFICVSMIGGNYIKEIIELRNEEQMKENELKLLRIRIEQSKLRQDAELKNREDIRRQRHDLRHQLTVLKDMNDSGKKEELSQYLDELIDDTIVKGEVRYCENIAVNAVIAYYAAMASENNIDCSVKTVVPVELMNISDSELCVVFGNLMENAIEACRRMKEGKRYLSIRSIVKFGKLVITMDNSYDGKVKVVDNNYISSKRNEVGIGLQSIRTVAVHHGGNASFEHEGGVFHSSVYVKI